MFLSYILPDTRKKSRQKTRVIKKTQDPVYNHAMVYDGFKTGEVSEACCELTVWDHNTLANQFLGGLRLSLGTGNKIFSSLQLYFVPNLYLTWFLCYSWSKRWWKVSRSYSFNSVSLHLQDRAMAKKLIGWIRWMRKFKYGKECWPIQTAGLKESFPWGPPWLQGNEPPEVVVMNV